MLYIDLLLNSYIFVVFGNYSYNFRENICTLTFKHKNVLMFIEIIRQNITRGMDTRNRQTEVRGKKMGKNG